MVAIVASLTAWLYVWYLLRGVRNEYGAGDIGAIPTWLMLLLGAGTLVTIGTAVAASMRFESWPWLSIASGLIVVLGVVASQYAVMNSTLEFLARAGVPGARPASVADALRAAVHIRSTAHLVLVSILPTFLILAGVSAWALPGADARPREVTGDG